MTFFRSVGRLVEDNYELLVDEVDRDGRASRALVLFVFVGCPVFAGILHWVLDRSPGRFTHEFVLAVAVLTGFALLSAVVFTVSPSVGRPDSTRTSRFDSAPGSPIWCSPGSAT